MSIQPTWQGEVQLRRWSESSTQGVQVTFALADSDELEPLKAKSGRRFAAVLVELNDDETPVQPQRKDTRGPLCREACDYCAMPEFQEWIVPPAEVWGPEAIKEGLLRLCGISSRKELDTDESAAARFVQQVRIPFMRWQRERKK